MYINMRDLGKVVVCKSRNSTWGYVDAVKTVKVFFGLITTRTGSRAGWQDLLNSLGDSDAIYDLQEVLERDSTLFYDGYRIMQKPYVVLYFLHMDKVVRNFDTIEAANNFAKKLVGDNVFFEQV